MTSRHAASQVPRGRATAVLLTVATACGLWFGITAPDISPVSAPAAPASNQVDQGDQGDQAPLQDPAPVVPPQVDDGPGRPGRGGGR
jgi:hypothetical protein